MDPRNYGKIGTTARAEKVNNQELLFPNGYDRNQNSDRPLVTVCDTAGAGNDDFSEEDFSLDSGSPSENVTVTIKFSSALDGIVTETDSRKSEKRVSSSPFPNGNEKQKPISVRECSFEKYRDDNSTREDFRNVLSGNAQDAENSHIDKFEENPPVVIVNESIGAKQPKENIQNNLYEEYERFVEPSEKQGDIVRPKSSMKTQLSREDQSVIETEENSKVKIVYETKMKRSSPPHINSIDRSILVSPVNKTPIIKETSSTSGDEAEDFLEYLKQLKGSRENCISEDEHSTDIDDAKCQHQVVKSKFHEERPKQVKSFKEELVPMLSVNATIISVAGHEKPVEVIVISDDEEKENADANNDKDKSLVAFDFGSLQRNKNASGGNDILYEELESSSNSDSSENKNILKSTKRKQKNPKKNSQTALESESDSDSDLDETDNDENDNEESDDSHDNKNSDKDDDSDDNNDDGQHGNDRNDDKDNHESEDNDNDNSDYNDENDGDSDHHNADPERETDNSESDGYENEGHFSPGMRSRTTDVPNKQDLDTISETVGKDERKQKENIRNNLRSNSALDGSFPNEIKTTYESPEIEKGYVLSNDVTLDENYMKLDNKAIMDCKMGDEIVKEPLITGYYSSKPIPESGIKNENISEFCMNSAGTCQPTTDFGRGETGYTPTIEVNTSPINDACVILRDDFTRCNVTINLPNENISENIMAPEGGAHDTVVACKTMPERGFTHAITKCATFSSDALSNTEVYDENYDSKACKDKELKENCDLDEEAEILSSSTDSLTAEDSEVIEILDYSETVNCLNCKFKTIDTYLIEEYESLSDDEQSVRTKDTAEDNHMLSETVTNDIDTNNCPGEKENVITNLNSMDIINSLIFNPDTSDDESFCSMVENNECFLEISNITSDSITSLKPACDADTDQEVKWDITVFSDSSSNYSEDVDASEFESAIDEEFWNNTVGSASEMSFSDKFPSSNNNTDSENGEEAFHDIGMEYENVEPPIRLPSPEHSQYDHNENMDIETHTSEHEANSETSDSDSEYDSVGDLKSSNEEAFNFIQELEKRKPQANNDFPEKAKENIRINGYEESERNITTDRTNCVQFKSGDGVSAYEISRYLIKSLRHRPSRTISYFAPFIKEPPAIKIIVGKDNARRFVCCQRKSLLERLLPEESSGVVCDRSNNCNMIDSLDRENAFLCTINDLKERSKLCTDGNQALPVGKPGEIIKLGIGYYIFGAGEKLDLPIGPKLKDSYHTNLDKDVNRPSIYFRGVPGIINNACKMSRFSFPKLAVQTDTSSRKILHACNRLATQLSPIEPRHDNRYVTMNSVSAVEDTDDTLSVSSVDLTDMLMASRDFLNSSRFDDAEAGFLKLYKEIQEKPEDNGRLLVETLTGLADICIRRSRMCRSNPLEWQWLCMHAIALLQYTVEFCDSELENQLDNEATEWYQEQRQASELKCRPLEDAFTRALYNCLKHDANFFDPFQSFSLPNTPVSQQRKPNLFPLSSTMPQYLLVPGMSYRVTDQGLKKQSSDDSDVAVDWLAKFQFYCKDRLQTKDAKCVTEKVLKSTKSTENDDTESLMSHGSHGSLDWDNSDLHGIEELEMDITDKESPLNDYCLEYELASSETDNEGWDFFLHQRRNCDLQSVMQVVANEEDKCDMFERENSRLDKETQDIYQQEKSEKTRRKHHEPRDIVSPLHAHSISLTLARSFCRLADKLVQEEEYKKAEIVYEKILDIIDAIQDGTAGMLRFSARIMKNLGTVKSKQGKSSSGLVLLNKALNTYRDLQDEEANFEIAVALIELGNGYIVGKNHEDSVFDDVIIAICDFFEKDASDSSSTSTSSSVQSHISQMTSSLTSNTEDRNVEEAVTCYTEAISLLDCYEADEKQVDMFAKAVMRLGDCHFMQKDYDKALECYEKALSMFRTYNIFGKDSLMENAHVLCMLGVSSFMLHVYPRAASVFETALHMVRCAYGFKRTFLNGMLQSLSGITYYKMKNYHKCVSMCYQGYETYCELFGESMPRLDKQKFWLVCQTLYVMGNSYNILSLQQKAMKYLSIARSLMKSSKSRERRQFMRVLQILGDCYFANYDYKTALQFYNEALEYGECESSISFDEVFDPNCASDEMTIHNHLVSKSAEAHLSMQQYQNAVHYLEQAHDMQEVMGEDIKGDLINTLHQLGHMHSVAGDVDKAIESYKECLEVFREIHKGQLEPEMCTTLGNLAAICYVKACIADTLEEEEKMTRSADAYFVEALALENNAEVCVKYGSFLYSQCHFENAIVQFWNALRNDHATADIVYRGLEKVTLPELLQDEVDTHDEICLPSTCLARYLLILSHKALHELEEAEINLICLMEEVVDYDVPLLHSLLGYAMMELMMFEEAADCFWTAAETEEEYQLACENYCICLLILLQKTLITGLENILDYVSKNIPNFCIDYSI